MNVKINQVSEQLTNYAKQRGFTLNISSSSFDGGVTRVYDFVPKSHLFLPITISELVRLVQMNDLQFILLSIDDCPVFRAFTLEFNNDK